METLVLDTSAIFNFGHRGQLEPLLIKLAKQYRFATTALVQEECGRGPQKEFYKSFVPLHFQILEPEKISIPQKEFDQLRATIDTGEISVMLLAADLKGIAVIDDRLARNEAARLGIRIMGTLGLIEQAMKLGWHTDDECIEIVLRLRAGKFSILPPGANETFAEYFQRFSKPDR
jgi:predicted nucleic acid-binding protein